MLLCNKTGAQAFSFSTSRLGRSSKTLFPRHRSGNARSISERELKPPACKAQALGNCCSGLAVSKCSDALRLFSGFRLARFCVVVRKLKIAPAGPVPLSDCHVVLINSLQHSAPGS